MRPIRILLAPRAASTTLLALLQAGPESGTAFVLTATAAGPIDPQAGTQLGLGRIVTISSSGDDSGLTFAIVGKDQNGNTVTENVTGANTGVAASANYYTSVQSITPSGNTASTVSAGIRGTTAAAALGTLPLDLYQRIGGIVAVDVTGTISYTVNMTFDDCLGVAANPSTAVYFATPASPTALTAQSASKYTQLPPGVCGLQVLIPTYSTGGSILLNVISPANSNMG